MSESRSPGDFVPVLSGRDDYASKLTDCEPVYSLYFRKKGKADSEPNVVLRVRNKVTGKIDPAFKSDREFYGLVCQMVPAFVHNSCELRAQGSVRPKDDPFWKNCTNERVLRMHTKALTKETARAGALLVDGNDELEAVADLFGKWTDIGARFVIANMHWFPQIAKQFAQKMPVSISSVYNAYNMSSIRAKAGRNVDYWEHVKSVADDQSDPDHALAVDFLKLRDTESYIERKPSDSVYVEPTYAPFAYYKYLVDNDGIRKPLSAEYKTEFGPTGEPVVVRQPGACIRFRQKVSPYPASKDDRERNILNADKWFDGVPDVIRQACTTGDVDVPAADVESHVGPVCRQFVPLTVCGLNEYGKPVLLPDREREVPGGSILALRASVVVKFVVSNFFFGVKMYITPVTAVVLSRGQGYGSGSRRDAEADDEAYIGSLDIVRCNLALHKRRLDGEPDDGPDPKRRRTEMSDMTDEEALALAHADMDEDEQ